MSEKRKRITKRRRRPPKHSHSTTRSHALTHTQRKPLTTRRRGAPKHCGRETTNHPSRPLFCVFGRETATRNPKQTPFEKEIHGWCIALCAFLCAFVFVFVIVKRLCDGSAQRLTYRGRVRVKRGKGRPWVSRQESVVCAAPLFAREKKTQQ